MPRAAWGSPLRALCTLPGLMCVARGKPRPDTARKLEFPFLWCGIELQSAGESQSFSSDCWCDVFSLFC